jgi:hypothetical protein
MKKRANVVDSPKKNGMNGVTEQPESTVLASLARRPTRRDKGNIGSKISANQATPVATSDSVIVSWDARGDQGGLPEFLSFLDASLVQHGRTAAALWGMTTVDMHRRTAMTNADLQRVIANLPGYDLYVCSPAPELEALHPNLWTHLQVAIPKFQPALRAAFKTLRWDAGYLTELQPSVAFSTSHYYIGSSKFWVRYLKFLRDTTSTISDQAPRSTVRFLDQLTKASSPVAASHWSLFIDRLLPIFLRLNPSGLKVARIPISAAEQKMNTHLRKLREMKDVAHRTKSQWMASCWLHYRNTYLLNVAGREWCQRNLPLMTPSSIRFY